MDLHNDINTVSHEFHESHSLKYIYQFDNYKKAHYHYNGQVDIELKHQSVGHIHMTSPGIDIQIESYY